MRVLIGKKDQNPITKPKRFPARLVVGVSLTLAEVLIVAWLVTAVCVRLPWFCIAVGVAKLVCAVKVVSSDANPDYKIPWLLFILIMPVFGITLYFTFYSGSLGRRELKRLDNIKACSCGYDDAEVFSALRMENGDMANYAQMLCKISHSHLFNDTEQKYFSDGAEMFKSMVSDLNGAKKFIYLEYFIVQDGALWQTVLGILKNKVLQGVEVRVLYDDFGCIGKLPKNYHETLNESGINAKPFSPLKWIADGKLNNRNHRKILVIDGYIGYTGGLNLADEYINLKSKYGFWKDGGIRLLGNAVWGLTDLFLMDFGLSVDALQKPKFDLYPDCVRNAQGYLVPFGDGPRPLYNRGVGKTAVQNMFNTAKRYVYLTTPYLIIDNELCASIENAALRGVEVKIILPHIPDKKTVFECTRSFYPRLLDAGVKIYEYELGFIHAKNFVSDDICAIVGTINLDYRSLVHHFEVGVWLYNTESVKRIKKDFETTVKDCLSVDREMTKVGFWKGLKRGLLRIFAPLL